MGPDRSRVAGADDRRTRGMGDRAPGQPIPVTHTLTIPNWHPSRLNQLMGHWAERARRKKGDAEFVFVYAYLARIPRATGKRRVDLVVTLAKGQRSPDRDAWWKSTLDALVHARLLRDDCPKWCVPGSVEYRRADGPATTILLTDMEDPTC